MFILTEKNQAAAVQQAPAAAEGHRRHGGASRQELVLEEATLLTESLRLLPGVRAVQRLTEPYPLAARTGHPEDTVVSVGKARIGQDLCLIAGPCAVESSEQVTSIARQVSAARLCCEAAPSSPGPPLYLWRAGGRGAGAAVPCGPGDGDAGGVGDHPIPQLPLFREVDVLQVGARNMQNFELLRELGRQEKPVLLKRSFGATVTELLQAAEYIACRGGR